MFAPCVIAASRAMCWSVFLSPYRRRQAVSNVKVLNRTPSGQRHFLEGWYKLRSSMSILDLKLSEMSLPLANEFHADVSFWVRRSLPRRLSASWQLRTAAAHFELRDAAAQTPSLPSSRHSCRTCGPPRSVSVSRLPYTSSSVLSGVSFNQHSLRASSEASRYIISLPSVLSGVSLYRSAPSVLGGVSLY